MEIAAGLRPRLSGVLRRRIFKLAGRGGREVARIDVAVDGFPLLSDGPIVIDAQIAADADEPRLKVGATIEGVERLVQLEEDVLREVLCLIVTTDELVRDVEHLPPVHADNRFPRRLIAIEAALDDLVGHLGRRGCVRRHRDQTVARDYDGDGITDVAVFRRGATATDQAYWYIRQSATNTARIVPFGTTGNGTSSLDAPIPGDYDGDGKFDIAVYRFGVTPTNTYIVLQSSNGAVTYRTFGNFNTDYVLPGDYDGDGKFDTAVFRPSTANWFVQRSTAGILITSFGASGDRPIPNAYVP